ncbi:unnamed protein product [Closterium sp. NIES-65]|nr:unnamed protein product [Closterium sp. NIES-65]
MAGGSLQDQLLRAKNGVSDAIAAAGAAGAAAAAAAAAAEGAAAVVAEPGAGAASAASAAAAAPAPTPASNFPLPLHLSWRDRIRIAAEIASALLCLHQSHPPILHRDLKPDNILLDQSCTSKVADVGLSCVVPSSNVVFTRKVRGTIGFIDPEAVESGELTTKSDVYAYGVVLMLLLTRFPAARDLHRYLSSLPFEVMRSPARAATARTSERRPYMEEVMEAVGAVARDAAARGDKVE